MGRTLGWALGLTAAALALIATPAEAQVRVDIGVGTPTVGARVVIGGRPVRVVERVPVRREPVYVDRRGGPPSWAPAWGYRRQVQRAVYRNTREREYSRDVRDAREEYERDVRNARRDYERDLREAQRDRRRW
jgi:hypothetical protein